MPTAADAKPSLKCLWLLLHGSSSEQSRTSPPCSGCTFAFSSCLAHTTRCPSGCFAFDTCTCMPVGLQARHVGQAYWVVLSPFVVVVAVLTNLCLLRPCWACVDSWVPHAGPHHCDRGWACAVSVVLASHFATLAVLCCTSGRPEPKRGHANCAIVVGVGGRREQPVAVRHLHVRLVRATRVRGAGGGGGEGDCLVTVFLTKCWAYCIVCSVFVDAGFGISRCARQLLFCICVWDFTAQTPPLARAGTCSAGNVSCSGRVTNWFAHCAGNLSSSGNSSAFMVDLGFRGHGVPPRQRETMDKLLINSSRSQSHLSRAEVLRYVPRLHNCKR